MGKLPQNVADAVELLDYTAGPQRQWVSLCAWKTIRAHLMSQEAEIDRLRVMLGECYAMSGADTDGDPPERHANDALRAVTELRRDHDESLDETAIAESRLAAANALLKRIGAYHCLSHDCKQGCPKDECEACLLDDYLQGAGDE